MAEAIEVLEVDFAERLDAIRSVRFAVFVEEQGVPAEIEMDEWDACSRHVLASKAGLALGTGRLLPDGHIGRLAVLPSYRGQGVGIRIMEELMRLGREAGLRSFVLSAQVQAAPFYEGLGFVRRGPVFEEAGIPHVEMTLEA